MDRKDIVKFISTAICEITIKDGVLPDKLESHWDSIGTATPVVTLMEKNTLVIIQKDGLQNSHLLQIHELDFQWCKIKKVIPFLFVYMKFISYICIKLKII